MKKQKSSMSSNISLVLGWTFFSTIFLFILAQPIYALFNLIFITDVSTGILIIVGHVFAFFISYKVISNAIKGTVSMVAFYTAMVITIVTQIFWRYMMFSWTRFACDKNCADTVLNYNVDLAAVYVTTVALVFSGLYLSLKITKK